MDIPLDLTKDDAWMESDQCSACKRAGLALEGCCAANCYAAFCGACKRAGVVYKTLFVCGMCARGREPVGDVFDTARKAIDPRKAPLNAEFVELVRRRRQAGVKVLVLDGGDGQTTRAVKALDARATVHVPNPDPVVCAQLAKLGATAHAERLGAFLTRTRRDPSHRVSCAWADYCGTYDGSRTSQIFPRQDLAKLWDTGLDRTRDAAVALTFCMRNNGCRASNIVDEQVATAALYGWAAVSTRVHRYGSMAFFVFEARRAAAAPDAALLDFARSMTDADADVLLRALKRRKAFLSG